MPSKQAEKDKKRIPWRGLALPVLAATFLSLVIVVVMQRVERFVSRDARFTIRAPGLPGQPSPDVRVTGISRTPAMQVHHVFARDFGRSAYWVDLEERRNTLRNIQWVREVSITRLWPNRLDVRVRERLPEAFVIIPGLSRRAPVQPFLIDGDGVLLPKPDGPDALPLPTLTGIHRDQKPGERAARVRLMKHVLAGIGKYAENVSEVDITDVSNVRLVMQAGDRAVALLCGNSGYLSRVKRFYRYYDEIRRAAPNATTFDLRMPNHITAVEDGALVPAAPESEDRHGI
jgi:cell division septal protein FtsQ